MAKIMRLRDAIPPLPIAIVKTPGEKAGQTETENSNGNPAPASRRRAGTRHRHHVADDAVRENGERNEQKVPNQYEYEERIKAQARYCPDPIWSRREKHHIRDDEEWIGHGDANRGKTSFGPGEVRRCVSIAKVDQAPIAAGRQTAFASSKSANR